MRNDIKEKLSGYVRQDCKGQYITNGDNDCEDGKKKIRLSNGQRVTIIIHDSVCPNCKRPY